MSRNGVATRAPFWMMRIRPPCSRTNRRPLPSLGTSIPVGDARPLTNADRPSAGGPPGGGLTAVLEEPPPQPNNDQQCRGHKAQGKDQGRSHLVCPWLCRNCLSWASNRLHCNASWPNAAHHRTCSPIRLPSPLQYRNFFLPEFGRPPGTPPEISNNFLA